MGCQLKGIVTSNNMEVRGRASKEEGRLEWAEKRVGGGNTEEEMQTTPPEQRSLAHMPENSK